MKNQLEQKVSITKSPYLITEVDKGEFYIVNSIVSDESDNWRVEFNINSILQEGLDIREYPNRNISILIESQAENPILRIVDKLKDFAYLGSYDYVSYSEPIVEVGSNIYKVNPRIFRKIVND